MDLTRLRFESPRSREPLVVSVGRLVEKKGFAHLIDACLLLHERGVTFRCVIVGEGELEARLRKQIASRGLEGVVEMVGPRPQEEVFRLVREAAAFAAPCVVGEDRNRDGLPTVLLEAMALGTPCVSTDVTGIPEVIRDGETGLLVPQGDAAALAQAVARLLGDGELRVALAGAARRLVEGEFDISKNSEQLRAVFAGASNRSMSSLGSAAVAAEQRLRGVG
jgi:glycosyltransferase involved in cell wall biosynthesis